MNTKYNQLFFNDDERDYVIESEFNSQQYNHNNNFNNNLKKNQPYQRKINSSQEGYYKKQGSIQHSNQHNYPSIEKDISQLYDNKINKYNKTFHIKDSNQSPYKKLSKQMFKINTTINPKSSYPISYDHNQNQNILNIHQNINNHKQAKTQRITSNHSVSRNIQKQSTTIPVLSSTCNVYKNPINKQLNYSKQIKTQNHLTQISFLKSICSDYQQQILKITSLLQAQKLFNLQIKEQSEHIKNQLYNSRNIQLQIQESRQLIRRLQKQMMMKNDQLSQLKYSYNKLQSDFLQGKSQLAQQKIKFKEMVDEYEGIIIRDKKQYEIDLIKVKNSQIDNAKTQMERQKNETQLQKQILQRQHQSYIQELTYYHQSQIKNIQASYKDQMALINDQHSSTLKQLAQAQQLLDDHKNLIIQLKINQQKYIQKLNQQYQVKLDDRLKEFLQMRQDFEKVQKENVELKNKEVLIQQCNREEKKYIESKLKAIINDPLQQPQKQTKYQSQQQPKDHKNSQKKNNNINQLLNCDSSPPNNNVNNKWFEQKLFYQYKINDLCNEIERLGKELEGKNQLLQKLNTQLNELNNIRLSKQLQLKQSQLKQIQSLKQKYQANNNQLLEQLKQFNQTKQQTILQLTQQLVQVKTSSQQQLLNLQSHILNLQNSYNEQILKLNEQHSIECQKKNKLIQLYDNQLKKQKQQNQDLTMELVLRTQQVKEYQTIIKSPKKQRANNY